MSKNKSVPENPLFSPGNALNFATNALFMPVQEQSPAIITPERRTEEEACFLGDSSAVGQPQRNVATFTMFSQKSEGSSDPFANIVSAPVKNQSFSPYPMAITTEQQEPQLFVPPASPPVQVLPESDLHIIGETNMQPPPFAMKAPSPITDALGNPSYTNPYSRSALAGQRSRVLFPSEPQTYQSPLPPLQHGIPATTAPIVPELNSHAAPNTSPQSEVHLSTNPLMSFANELPQPVSPHWFYCKQLSENNVLWCPFSDEDSCKLEAAFQTDTRSTSKSLSNVIITDGGRYDVNVLKRERQSVYWEEPSSVVRRCTWYHKADNENLYTPYDELTANKLENEYQNVVKNGLWHKRIELPNEEVVVIHNPQLIVHFQPTSHSDEFGSIQQNQPLSKIVKRGINATDFLKDIPESEIGVPDHVVFVCHGVGPVCDLRSRNIVECVDDFRSIHLKLMQSHFKQSLDANKAKRIEYLPVHWHQALHGDATGVDRHIRRLTLPSISRLRHFTNETLLDILFYSSPVYCQTIAETVGNEINALYQRFLSRNPTFAGKVSLVGHSLGSLILFDLLCHQMLPGQMESSAALKTSLDTSSTASDSEVASLANTSTVQESMVEAQPPAGKEKSLSLQDLLQQLNLESFHKNFEDEQIDMDALLMCSESDFKDIGLPLGPRKKLLGFLKEEQEREKTSKEQAAQITLAKQENILSTHVENKADDKKVEDQFDSTTFLSTATNVHVDFQQYDSGTGQPAVCYPQLNFSPQALFALGSPIGMFLTVRGIADLGEDFSLPTCRSFINVFHPFDPVAYRVEPLINPDSDLRPVQVPHYKGRKRLHLELKESLGRMGQELKQGIIKSVRFAIGSMQKFAQSHWNQAQQNAQVEEEVKHITDQLISEQSEDNVETASAASDTPEEDVGFGQLNGGKRIDFVLQERPLESFNDYLFAFQSHLCYWNNEDTVLLMMKEIYGSVDVLSDKQLNKQQLSLAPNLATAAALGARTNLG